MAFIMLIIWKASKKACENYYKKKVTKYGKLKKINNAE